MGGGSSSTPRDLPGTGGRDRSFVSRGVAWITVLVGVCMPYPRCAISSKPGTEAFPQSAVCQRPRACQFSLVSLSAGLIEMRSAVPSKWIHCNFETHQISLGFSPEGEQGWLGDCV